MRRWLHRLGYRYLVDVRPEPSLPRRADLVFRGPKVAVFVDGCFWHGCPDHMSWPTGNADWWKAKIAETRQRDADTTAILREAGWTVVRIWEHEDSDDAGRRILEHVDRADTHRARSC